MKLWSIIPGLILALPLLLAYPSAGLARSSGQKLEVKRQRVLFAIVGWMYDIDPDLLQAISTVESGGRAGATSPKGAQGLMQLMPETAQSFDVRDPYDPIDNALGAARFISFLRMRQAADIGATDLPSRIAAYNAGEGSVRHFRGIPPYAETRDYVRKVLWLYLTGANPHIGSASSTPSRSFRAVGPVTDNDVLERLSSIRHARTAAEKVQSAQVEIHKR